MLKRRFDLRLHGHDHRGWIEKVSRVKEERDHLRISAGACYAASEKERAGQTLLTAGTSSIPPGVSAGRFTVRR